MLRIVGLFSLLGLFYFVFNNLAFKIEPKDELSKSILDEILYDLKRAGIDSLFTIVETTSIQRYDKDSPAPVIPKEMAAQDYIRRYKDLAIEHHKKYGILASITMAQALIESNAGNSTLARENNNHFGTKCFSRKCKTGHCRNKTDDSHKDFFIIYPNVASSYVAHSLLLRNNNYKLHTFTDYRQAAKQLQAKGYATDPNYANKLINVIETHKLYLLDSQSLTFTTKKQ